MKLKTFIKEKIPKKIGNKIIEFKYCGICGEKSEYLYSDILSSNFTNWDIISSPHICFDCSRLFNDNYRKKSFYITEKEAKTVRQEEIADILRNIELPCILSFTESNKKHRLFRSKINYNREKFIIVTDNDYIEFNLNKDIPLLDYLEKVYNKYKISKGWITGVFSADVVKKMGIDEYIILQNKINQYKNLPQLSLLVSFINKHE